MKIGELLMNEYDLDKYKHKCCRIIIEKKQKLKNIYQYVFGTVEIVNNRFLYISDAKDSWFQISIEAIQDIQVNEEQW
jgi:hypothetical protein